MSELDKALNHLMNMKVETRPKSKVALMEKREANLVSTALNAMADRLHAKGDTATANILREASSKIGDSDQIHIVHNIATA